MFSAFIDDSLCSYEKGVAVQFTFSGGKCMYHEMTMDFNEECHRYVNMYFLLIQSVTFVPVKWSLNSYVFLLSLESFIKLYRLSG